MLKEKRKTKANNYANFSALPSSTTNSISPTRKPTVKSIESIIIADELQILKGKDF